MRKYVEQYARIHRYLAQLQTASKGYIHSEPSIFDSYRDSMYAFFQNCWHMRDWIGYDYSIPAHVREAIRKEAERTRELLICADLANASKHLQLNRKARVGAEDSELIINIDTDASVSWEFIIEMNDGTAVSAIQAGLAAVNAWEAILQRHGLPVEVVKADA